MYKNEELYSTVQCCLAYSLEQNFAYTGYFIEKSFQEQVTNLFPWISERRKVRLLDNACWKKQSELYSEQKETEALDFIHSIN